MNKKNPFEESIVERVLLEEGEVCDWRRHFLNAPRETIGFFESQACKWNERFVWARVPRIVSYCNQYQREKRPYSKRQIEYSIEFLRQLGIVIRVKGVLWQGARRNGWVIVPHDAVCDRFGAVLPDGKLGWECKFQTGPKMPIVGEPDLMGQPGGGYVKVRTPNPQVRTPNV